jgi:hypothetical protein
MEILSLVAMWTELLSEVSQEQKVLYGLTHRRFKKVDLRKTNIACFLPYMGCKREGEDKKGCGKGENDRVYDQMIS